MSTALSRPSGLDLQSFARLASLHPDLVRRLVALGLLEPRRDASGRMSFAYSDLVAVARLQRLRTAFSLNYAALGLVVDLLDRIAALEAELRNRPRPARGRSWI